MAIYFLVHVRIFSGRTIEIFLPFNATLDDLKRRFMFIEGPPPTQQRFVFQGKEVPEGILSEFGIIEGSVVHFWLRIRGG